MSLGWGLRGFIGGGPLGAMIPGAMVGLLLCYLLRLDQKTSAFVAAFGAIGVGLGGQMTYGQTIGFIIHPETFFWGFLGLSVKGAVWGLLGGAVLGLGFIHRQMSRKVLVAGLLLLIVGTLIGWKLINEPKLIYFSNLHDRPRAEIWAGLLFGAIFLLAYLGFVGQAKIPLHFALWGTLGGAIPPQNVFREEHRRQTRNAVGCPFFDGEGYVLRPEGFGTENSGIRFYCSLKKVFS